KCHGTTGPGSPQLDPGSRDCLDRRAPRLASCGALASGGGGAIGSGLSGVRRKGWAGGGRGYRAYLIGSASNFRSAEASSSVRSSCIAVLSNHVLRKPNLLLVVL